MKKRTFVATIAVALVAGVSIFVACTKEDNRNGYTKLDTDPISEEGCFYLGNQLENAYSVTNMQKAYDTLLANGMNDYVNVHCTHYYVKFYPETKAEYDLLMADTSLDLFDFPLDYELIGEGTLCSKNEDFNVLYTVVPVDFAFPNIRYTILENCFIPGEDATEAEEKVEMQSLILTNNLEPDDTINTPPAPDSPDKRWFSWILPSKKYPSGTFKVLNTENNQYDPIQNVKVVTFKLVKIAHTYTNANGYYHIPKGYRWPCHYFMFFRNQNSFDVWGNLGPLAPAFYHMGRQSKYGHSRNLGQYSVAFPWATVNNAACTYIKEIVPAENIQRPPYNLRFWVLPEVANWSGNAMMGHHMNVTLTTLSSFCQTTIGRTLTGSLQFILPDICVFKNDASDNNLTKKYYGTTFHEMGHANHFGVAGEPYWAAYITATISNNGYGTDSVGTLGMNGYIGVGEMWGYFFENWNMNNYLSNLANYSYQRIYINTTYWFNPRILDSLCRRDGLDITPKKILGSMTNDVHTVGALKERLKRDYGYGGKDLIIDSIFHHYGF